MRRIDPSDFKIAKRSTSRDINRQIALSLIQAHQPISRAELAKKMNIGRGVITVLTNELINENLIFEGEKGEAPKGRKPTFLHIKTDTRLVVAIDIRASKTYLMLTDFAGNNRVLETWETRHSTQETIKMIVERTLATLKKDNRFSFCQGVGVVIPGIIDHQTGKILRAPTLGWENVELREQLSKRIGLPVKIENAPKACALAQIWMNEGKVPSSQNFVYLSVSDGVGVGIVMGGELVRGRNDIAGEFGHIQIEKDGDTCSCGKRGCWEILISNPATVKRYSKKKNNSLNINDLIDKAKNNDQKALESLNVTGKYLGLGLSNIINILNPEVIYVGGEITRAWDLIRDSVTKSIAENALIREAAQTPIRIAPTIEYPRLRGAAALIVAPTFAALKVA